MSTLEDDGASVSSGSDSDSEFDATGMIVPIQQQDVRRIVAGQVVSDLASTVKELIDNSLDAGAVGINIRLFNQGLDVIEVSDDGSGVPTDSRPLLAMKHATSKLRSFDELYQDRFTNENDDDDDKGDNQQQQQQQPQQSLGFRGEALFSLANMSQNLVISTRTEQEPLGTKMEFRRDGYLDAKTMMKDVPRKIGTTVAVVKLFAALPVRRADFIKRIAQQRAKMLRLLQSYAVLCVGVRFNLIDITGPVGSPSCKTEVKMCTSEKSKGLQDTISAVFGYSFLSGLCQFKLDLEEIVDKEFERRRMICSRSGAGNINGIGNGHSKKKSIWRIEGMVARAPGVETKGGKNIAREIQFFSVNGRPVELPRASRIISDVWRNFESSGEASKKRPACILGVYIPNSMYDINVSPDKRDVIISNESIIYDALRDALMELWSKQSGGNFRANEVEQASNSNSNGGSSTGCGTSTTLSGQKRPIASRETDRLPQGGSVPSVPAQFPTIEQEAADKKEKMERRNAFVNHFTNVGERNTDDTVRRRSFIDIASANQVTAQSHNGSNGLPQSNSNLNASASIGNDYVASPAPSEPKRMRFSRRGSTVQSFSMEQRNWNQTKIELNPPESRSQQEEIDAIQSQSSRTKINDSGVRLDPPQAGSDVNTNQNANTGTDKASITKNRQSSSTKRRVTQKQSSLELLKQFAHGNNNGPRACTNLKAATRITSPTKSSESESESTSTPTSLSEDERGNIDLITITKRTTGHMSNPPVKKSSKVIHIVDDEIDSSDQETKSDGSPPEKDEKSSYKKPLNTGVHSTVDNDQPSLPSQKVVWEGFDTASVIQQSRSVGISFTERKNWLKQMKAERINANSKNAEYQEGNDHVSLQSNKSSTVSLSKEDFVQMTVIGQFNLGFLLALGMDGHLWILDQHACDEIYNFEKLCKETKIHEQKLIAPLPLELSPSEENCVVEHMDVFESNGFRFSYDATKPPRHRLCLTALPHSGSGGDGRKAVQFGPEDVGALCGMLGADGASSSSGYIAGSGTGADGSGSMGNNAVRRHAGAGGAIVRLPKAVAMFASRACRRSIMIGDHLSQKQMEDIITKLRNADQPWNCPHGRPTIRHITDLLEGLLEDERDAAKRVTAGHNMALMSQE